MTFTRTHSGLSNQHKFYNVDVIIFVEGGNSLTIEDVQAGLYNNLSIDIQFWSKIFKKFGENKKFKFKAVGSKSTLIEIASLVQRKIVHNIYVAMDREFDGVLNPEIKSHGVFYTYGYSWENDVFGLDIIKEVISSIYNFSYKDIEVTAQIKSLIADFENSLNIYVCADAYLFNSSKTFFPRQKPLACLIFGPKQKPGLNISEIEKIFNENNLNNIKILEFGETLKIDPIKHCYGHLLSNFYYWILVYMLNSLGGFAKISRYYAFCLSIDKFISNIENPFLSKIKNYYEDQFANYAA